MTVNTNVEIQTKWAVVLSVKDLTNEKKAQLEEFYKWFMKTLKHEGSLIGLLFSFEDSPVIVTESEVDNFNSCTNAYQEIQNSHPQVVLVVHILPCINSNEYDWMKVLSQRYGFIRQGLLYENTVNRYEGNALTVQGIFRNMSQWITRSGLSIIRDGNSCGLFVGKSTKPTFEKVLFNSEDIHDAVKKVLHKDDYPKGLERENCIKISGYPELLNSFGIAQLVSPFRVIGVTIQSSNEAIVTLENKFQAYQAVLQLNGKELSRNNTISVSALGNNVNEHLEST